MPGRSIRFLHASDFHLERPVYGGADPPETLRDRLIEAPYRAAARVFDIAIEEQVDFVVLAGDLVDPWRSGPRGPLFLVEQFERLRARGIDVFWAGGRVDAVESWPAGFELPPNARRFPQGRPEAFVVERDAESVARVVGQSHDPQVKLHPTDLRHEDIALFTVAVAYVKTDAAALSENSIDYWALGGHHERESLRATKGTAHYCGSPQGRSVDEPGPHGCTLVQVDTEGRPRSSSRVTDVFRFREEHLTLPTNSDRKGLDTLLAQQIRAMQADAPGVDQLVSWTISGLGGIADQLRRGRLAEEILDQLRTKYGNLSPCLYSLSFEVAPPPPREGLVAEENTILGDFLRSIHAAQADDGANIDLAKYLFGQDQHDSFSSLARIDDAATRRRVLQQAAALGIDLLTAEGERS